MPTAALFAAYLLLAAPVAPKPTLVVAPLQSTEVEQSNAATLTEMIRIQVGQSKRYTLVTPEDIGSIDEELKRQLSGGCDEARCMVEIGGALGARFMITGKFSRLGRRYMLLLKLLDIEQVKAINTASIQAENIEGVADQITYEVGQLLGEAAAVFGFDDEEGARTQARVRGAGIRPETGAVVLTGRPDGASVTLKGPGGIRQTQIGQRVRGLRPGLHTWQASAPGYETGNGELTVQVDGIAAVTLRLRKLASLTVQGKPARSKVVVRGPEFIKTIGIGATLSDLAFGNYTIRVSKGGFEAEVRTVRLTDGAKERLVFDLKPPGTLAIDGQPSGARVSVEGPNGFSVERGLPMVIEGTNRGEYKVTVSRAGYRTQTRTVAVQSGQRNEAVFTLKRESAAQLGIMAEKSSSIKGPRSKRKAIGVASIFAGTALGAANHYRWFKETSLNYAVAADLMILTGAIVYWSAK